MITTTSALEVACKDLSQAPYVTVDTEFMRDQTYWPKLCLIQVARQGAEYVIDPLAEGLDLASFYDLMRNKAIVKVFHAARQDIEIFFHEADAIPDPLFDTQVAAMVCGFGESVGYETLVRKLSNGSVDKSSRFTDWSRRPLTQKQLDYAVADVTYLRTIYEKLAVQITQSNRTQWVSDEMSILQSPSTYHLEPVNAWKRLKMRVKGNKAVGVLMQVAAWREEQAQARNVPRNRIMKDDGLFELANQRPQSGDALEKLRSVPRGFSNSKAAPSLLAAIKTGLNMDDKDIPIINGMPPLPSGIGPLVELLKVLMKLRCEENNVAPKLIATVSDLEQIAAFDEKAQVSALKGWRYEIFGRDALALKNGELAVALKHNKLVLLKAADMVSASPQAEDELTD